MKWTISRPAVAFWAVASIACASVCAQGLAVLDPVDWDLANQRWRDIRTNSYSAAQTATYDYGQATVVVDYDVSAPSFTGVLTAAGLKPNFAYQMKLGGKPTYYWGAAAGNDGANEVIGLNGRWWVNQVDKATGITVAGWNGTDAEYADWKALGFTDGTYDYVFEGYLLFDYFVTDKNGNAEQPFYVDSSFHVLWKTTQRTPAANDSATTTHSVVVSNKSVWYDRKKRTKNVSLYAEWQEGRALPGELVLPEGAYNLRLSLTEESFHESASGSGYWATVMGHDSITFDLAGAPPPPEDAVMAVGDVVMGLKKKGRRVSALATVTIVSDAGQPVSGATVQGTWDGAVQGVSEGVTDSNGQVTLTSPKVGNPVRDFVFAVVNVVKTGWIYDPDLNVVDGGSIPAP